MPVISVENWDVKWLSPEAVAAMVAVAVPPLTVKPPDALATDERWEALADADDPGTDAESMTIWSKSAKVVSSRCPDRDCVPAVRDMSITLNRVMGTSAASTEPQTATPSTQPSIHLIGETLRKVGDVNRSIGFAPRNF